MCSNVREGERDLDIVEPMKAVLIFSWILLSSTLCEIVGNMNGHIYHTLQYKTLINWVKFFIQDFDLLSVLDQEENGQKSLGSSSHAQIIVFTCVDEDIKKQ